MARILLLFFALLIGGSVSLEAQTSVFGVVTDAESGEPVLFCNVALFRNGVLQTGTQTDFDGNYSISNIDPGSYDIEVSYVGYQTRRVTGVLVQAGRANKVDLEMEPGVQLDVVEIVGYKVPLIEQDNTTQGGTVTAEQIQRLPTKDINAIVANVAGTSSSDEGGAITVKGSRSDATDYYIDGIRVRGNMIPQTEIEQLQVITGGIEAQYGDVTGGIISITTKGPSNKFSGGFEVETSQYLDNFGYNLAMVNLAGPILRNKQGRSVLGYRVSGQYLRREDDRPPGIPVYRVKDEVLEELEANPMRIRSGSPSPAAEELGWESVNELRARPFETNTRYDLTARLDARINDAIDVSFTGTYNYVQDFFTPGGWRVYNSHNNPFDQDLRYRGNVRLRHRLGGGSGTDASGQAKASVIRNASYTLQFGYERQLYNLSDVRHGDNFFNYGHIGNFDYEWVNAFGAPVDPVDPNPIAHRAFRREFRGYTPGDINPVLANYNNQINTDVFGDPPFAAENGFIASNFTSAWGLHTNVGTVYNLYRERDNEVVTFVANSSFEIVPGGNEKGRHSIQFGIWYEQRTGRGYDLNPNRLYLIGRQQANRNILGVDTSRIIGDTTIGPFTIPIFDKFTVDQEDLLFYQRVRQLTGQGLNEFVNVDGISPDQLSLDMFSSRELTSQNILYYWGTDHLGNAVDVSFDDFFTATDANGVRTFPVAPFQPLYTAAYIQDRFTFRDIIFRVGVRVDRFDANTRVLKDPYSLYEIMNASDFHNQFTDQQRPSTIGDDYAVYVESELNNSVRAYRQGDQWYRPNGTQVNDPRLIFGGELVQPKYTVDDPNIQARDFDPNISFEDYTPQVNVMPRLAFSFPISDEANFFAHYDVLVQRPPSNNLATALDYFYFLERGQVWNNPNLRPERTVDYEIGFQQKLTNSSAIKIAAYYKEMRDMIQSRVFAFVAAPINTYTTYDNLDFGTVKGFTFQYDLRRTGNLSLLAAYTLQFADGTGSDANSSRGLSSRGIQRVLFPLSFDERHRMNLSLDYRYASGRLYNGPRIMGADILANTGLNVQAIAVSGRPYTATLIPTVLGGAGTKGAINGARLPWNYTVNLRLDRDILLTKADAKRPLMMNVYLRVSNVFDRRNIISVYSATGSPSDDGYLSSARGQDTIDDTILSGRNIDSYLASYQWAMLNPNLFTLPRRIFVGGIMNF
jgi:outer membrane receptor protein involved in Fe transport